MKCGSISRKGAHDWVLVRTIAPVPYVDEDVVVTPLQEISKLLWACPCDAFKWTSYADWEERQTVTVVDDKPAESPEEAERRRKELLEWDEKRREIPPTEAYQSPEALDLMGREQSRRDRLPLS